MTIGIEQTDLQGAERGHHQKHDQDRVLEVLSGVIAVRSSMRSEAGADVEQPADELVQGAVRTHPVAEHAPEQEGDGDDDQPPAEEL